jgi:ribosome-interacting GTPase 1
MPTNLPPDYFEIEKRFREAETTEEKIELLEEMYSVVPKHKGTDHLRADLRRRLSRLKEEAETHKGAAKRDSVFRIPKAGAGQVVIIGPGRVGKSTLAVVLSGIERTDSGASHPTFEPDPRMMPFENIHIQIIDTPPLSREYVEPRLKDLIRRADMAVLVVDLQQDPIAQLKESIALLEEFRIGARHRQERYPEGQILTFLPLGVVVNKCDAQEDEDVYQIFCELMDEKWPCTPVSALTGRNLERLKEEMVKELDIIRVYTKMPGKDADLNTPFAFKRGSSIESLAGKIHKEVLNKMKSARVWGKAVHPGQMVQRDYVLQDGDVVEIHTL